jgi:hypothetical protein
VHRWRARGHHVAFVAIGLGISTARAAGPAEQVPAGLSVTAVVDRDRIAAGESFAFWVTFENRTGAALTGLRFVGLSVPVGLARTGKCWSGDLPNCALGASAGSGLPSTISAGGAATVSAELQADSRPGRHVAVAVYRWQAADGTERRGAVVIGPVEVIPSPWQKLKEDWLSALKDLVLPLALVFVGWRLKTIELRRAETQQTWTTMLTKSHQNAEKHYLPITQSTSRWPLSVAKLQAAVARHKAAEEIERALDEAFFDFLLLVRKARELSQEIGGLYFKDRLGESLASRCWVVFKLRHEARFGREGVRGREELAWAMDQMTTRESFAEFAAKLSETRKDRRGRVRLARRAGRLGRLRESARRWFLRDPGAGDIELDLLLTKLFGAILDYEMNRPYQHWYGAAERFPLDDFEGVRVALDTRASTLRDDIEEVRDELDRYIRNNWSWWRSLVRSGRARLAAVRRRSNPTPEVVRGERELTR